MKITDQVAIITGGSSGIGKATVEKFMEAEAAGVAIADVNNDAAQEIAAEVTKKHKGEAIAIQTDVAKPESVAELARLVMDRFGRIDILVNNAGICPVTPWDAATVESWNHILSVNLTGAFLCTKAVLPHMRQRKYGRIVYMSSVGAFQGSLVAHVAYGASKAGMIALMKSIAKGFGAEGINANAITPGTVDTPLTDSFSETIKRRFAEAAPLKRQGTAEELADATLFLVSSRATYINGATLHVNGGSLLV